jgi:prophage regulatory protein
LAAKIFPDLPDEARVRAKQILEIYPINQATFWRWVSKGIFPKPIKLGPNTTVWTVGSIREFERNRS